MKRSPVVLLLAGLLAEVFPGCKLPSNTEANGCPLKQSAYSCRVYSDGPCSPTFLGAAVCAADQQQAEQIGNMKAIFDIQPGEHVKGVDCWIRGTAAPPLRPQGTPPSCDAGDADGACLLCAKAACCADYQACAADLNCSCLVACLGQGSSVDTCTAADSCGAGSAIANATAACLFAACPSQCENPGGMSGGMCPPMTGGGGSSSSSSSGGGCTPGPTGSGQPCFSDGDCASCGCDEQTMTCD